MAANTNTEREAFEAHFKKPPFEFEMDRFNSDGAWPGSYVIYYVQCAWEAWQARASLSLPAAGQEPVAKLWLWKNFVNGKPEYWAFDNPFPCESVGGDPLTFGEPCGWALLKPSANGRPDRSEQEVTNTVMSLAAVPQPAVAAGWEKALAPLRVWWAMHEAQWELCDETPSDDTVVLQFMGSGASTTVTAGQMRTALALPPAPSTEGA